MDEEEVVVCMLVWELTMTTRTMMSPLKLKDEMILITKEKERQLILIQKLHLGFLCQTTFSQCLKHISTNFL